MVGAALVLGGLAAVSYFVTFREGSAVIEPTRLILELVDVTGSPLAGATVTVSYDGQPVDSGDVVSIEKPVTDAAGRTTLVVSTPLRSGGWRWRLWWLIEVSDWPQPWSVQVRTSSAIEEFTLDTIAQDAAIRGTHADAAASEVVLVVLRCVTCTAP